MKLFLNKIIKKLLCSLNIYIIYRLGNAIGEQVCMTSVISKLKKENNLRAIVISNYPDIFNYNPNIVLNINYNNVPKGIKLVTYKMLQYFDQSHVYLFSFKSSFESFEQHMLRTKKKEHLIQTNSYQIDIIKNDSFYDNQIFFNENEQDIFEKKFGHLQEFSLIQPQGRIDYTPNKEWGFENYQQVINSMQNIIWVQVGMSNDKLLDNVIDLRGKTTRRELFFVISKANFILSNEGLLNHISSSFNTQSFVLFSGFHPIEISLYSNTLPIVKNPQVECAPCWLKEKCPKEIKYCTEDILVRDVVKIIEDNI